MKGLLRKDLYLLNRQMRIYLVLIIVFAVIPGYNMTSFAMLYAALLPITAMAYDERSKWDRLAAMMPYTPGQLVGVKYILGGCAILFALAVCVAARFVTSLVRGEAFGADALTALVLYTEIAFILLAITLPLIHRLGVEKGRIAFLICMAAFIAAATFLVGTLSEHAFSSQITLPLLAAAGAGVLLLNLGSVALSARIYARHRR